MTSLRRIANAGQIVVAINLLVLGQTWWQYALAFPVAWFCVWGALQSEAEHGLP